MSRHIFAVIAALGVCSLMIFATFQSASLAQAQDKEKPKVTAKEQSDKPRDDGRVVSDLRQFMRLKLAASNKILEGLATEDMALIREGAQKLNTLSLSEKWRAHNDVMYKQFSGEFQRVTKDLIQAANDDNLDQAALKWMGATMACIECHRFVRNTLVVDLEEVQ